MKLASKIPMLNRIVSDLKADKRDPFEHLTLRERNALADYQRFKSPEQQYVDAMAGNNPNVALMESVGIKADCTETEAREAYELELASFDNWFKRRNLMRAR